MTLDSFSVPLNDLSRKPPFTQDQTEQIMELILKGPYLNGAHTRQFENDFSNFVGSKYALGVSSGTSALQIAFRSLNLEKGSQVIVTANSGGYSTIAALQCNLNPIFAEVSELGILNPDSMFDHSSNPKAIVVTHLYGQAAPIDRIVAIAKERNVFVIEDCAQAAGLKYMGKMVGSWADISTFSFYPTKNLAAIGDAGAITTSDDEIYQRARWLREYGWSQRYWAEIQGGSNFRIDEIQALILNFRLPNLMAMNSRRKEIWMRYQRLCMRYGVGILGSLDESFVAHLAVLQLPNRQDFVNHMKKFGIETTVHYPYPDYVQPGFNQINQSALPITEMLCESVVSIPCFPEMTEGEVIMVETALSGYFEAI
jgi:dTDP-4-amino-4,6-dideoxygalactose transaminase